MPYQYRDHSKKRSRLFDKELNKKQREAEITQSFIVDEDDVMRQEHRRMIREILDYKR